MSNPNQGGAADSREELAVSVAVDSTLNPMVLISDLSSEF